MRVATSLSWCPLVLVEAEDDYILKQSPFIFSLAAVFTPHLHDFIKLEVKIRHLHVIHDVGVFETLSIKTRDEHSNYSKWISF